MSHQCSCFDLDLLTPLHLMMDLLWGRADRQDKVILDEALFNKVCPTRVEVMQRRRQGEVSRLKVRGRSAALSI